MAITLMSFSDKFEVAIQRDTALDMTEDEFKAYVESKYSKALLKMKPGQEPTLFVMRKVLPYELACKVQNAQAQITEKGKMNFQMSVMLEHVRAALIDIVNPPSVPADQAIKFVKASDGGADEELVAVLHAAGIIPELYMAHNSVTKDSDVELLKKK